MKFCDYCGRENDLAARFCRECGTEFAEPTTAGVAADEIGEAPILPVGELAELDLGFEVIEGFSRPNWKTIRAFIKERIPQADWSTAWHWVAAKWLETLAEDLGGGCRVYQSDHFFCLSDLDTRTTKVLLDYAESSLYDIRASLKEAAWTGYYGRHVLLLFSDSDDYFSYISYFFTEGTHILSTGVFISRDYAHIALPFVDVLRARHVIVHELVHNLLCKLPMPLWLNEGLAVDLERQASNGRFLLDLDLLDMHRAYWNETSIQTFWAGTSYDVPGDVSQLSYELGGILVNLLAKNQEDFITFIQNADRRDGGQDAAVSILNQDLGEVLGGFLGPGNWRPQRKAIADCWKNAQ